MTSSLDASPTLLLDTALIARLRADLTAAEWATDTIEGLLSPAAMAAMRRDQFTPAAIELEANPDPAAILTRLFVLAEPVDRESLDRALPTLGASGAMALGLVREGTQASEFVREGTQASEFVREAAQEPKLLRAAVSLRPYHGQAHWWVASDLSQAQTGKPPREDYVLGVASASENLARITLRDPVGTALDLGCGCGVIALDLTCHSQRVIATDISERACTFTRFNTLLNGVEIDVRQGSFFDPVAGERFDLITSNPPFVITPQVVRGTGKLEYRDGGMERDQLIPWIIKEATSRLAAGGTLQLLANWEVTGAETAWATRPTAWIESAAAPALKSGQPVRAWLVQRDLLDIAQYAEWWIRDAHGPQMPIEQWRGEYRQWMEDFTAARTQFIGLGSLTLHVGVPANGNDPASGLTPNGASEGTAVLNLSCEYLPEGQPIDALAVRTTLDNLTIPTDWESTPLLCAPDVREVRYFVPGSANPELIHMTQGRAGGRERSVTSAVAALIGVSDGEIAPIQVIPAIAQLLDQDEESVRAEISAALPELLRAGVVALT